MRSRKWFLVLALSLALVLTGVLRFRVVASMDGANLLYEDKVYEESYEVFAFEKGQRLGTVDFHGTSRCGLYKIKNFPEHLYLDMGLDNRIYQIVSE